MPAVSVQFEIDKLLQLLEVKLTELHVHQVERAKKAAHRIRPNFTGEDLLNPDNFPEIIADANFMYEDGQAAGIMSAKINVRQVLIELKSKD